MIFYLAGKIRNNPYYREQFKTAEEFINHMEQEAMHTALSPANLPDNLETIKYMPICLAMLEQADAICIIRDAEHPMLIYTSEGTRIELLYAKYQKKEVYYLTLRFNPAREVYKVVGFEKEGDDYGEDRKTEKAD